MSDTPKTDALREVIIGQYKENELTGNGMGNILAALTDIETLERERDEARADLEFRRGLFQLQEQQLNEVRSDRDELKRKHHAEHELANEAISTWKKTKEERDALQEQLDAALMLGKMQERRYERELEQVRLTSAAERMLGKCRQSPTTDQ